ncbi:MAG TPA: zf-HC2 domain-containing protein [Vicinamibacteria bacterium]|nr:zf-HC2 domain-containing protein [Vicinamibacteria bacterium]
MTCTRYEADLALYVEHDLADADAAAVEAHLRECATCPPFLAELRASQAQLKDLASEEMEAEALAAVRVRLVVAAAATRPRNDLHVPTWAAAAAIIMALGTILWVAVLVRWTEPARTVDVSSPPRIGPTASPPAAEPSPRSTLPGPRVVSPHMEQAQVRRGREDSPSVVPALSVDDADQLARAVVAIARIRSVPDAEPDVEPSPRPAPLMRLATADPDIVIYWQLEPNGGE